LGQPTIARTIAEPTPTPADVAAFDKCELVQVLRRLEPREQRNEARLSA